jgi:hypothetical protein
MITGSSGFTPTVDYEIDNISIFVNKGPTDEFEWSFDESRVHTINQIIHYNDGFENRLKSEIFHISMQTIANYEHEKYGCGFKYTSTSVAGTPPIVSYEWDVVSDGIIIYTGTNNKIFNYAWPYAGNFTINLRVTDSVGNFDIKSEDFVHVECTSGIISGGSGGGGIVIREVEKPDPIIRVNLRYKEDHEIINTETSIKVELEYDGGN